MEAKIKKVYAVTGVEHGSIVHAYTREEAQKIFQDVYKDENIYIIKDISNYNLENL